MDRMSEWSCARFFTVKCVSDQLAPMSTELDALPMKTDQRFDACSAPFSTFHTPSRAAACQRRDKHRPHSTPHPTPPHPSPSVKIYPHKLMIQHRSGARLHRSFSNPYPELSSSGGLCPRIALPPRATARFHGTRASHPGGWWSPTLLYPWYSQHRRCRFGTSGR